MTDTVLDEVTDPRERANYLGGSDMAGILGLSPWITPMGVYESKIDPQREPETKAQTRGKRLEPFVLQEFFEEAELHPEFERVPARALVHPEHAFMRGHIDAALRTPDYAIIPVEAKTAHPVFVNDWGAVGTDAVPQYYLTQVAYYMMLADAPFCYLAVWIGWEDFRYYRIDRNVRLDEILMRTAVEFWSRIEEREPPEALTLEDVRLQFKDETQGLRITPSKFAQKAIREKAALKTLIRKAELRIADLDVTIAGELGEAEAFIDDDNRTLVKFATRRGSTYTVTRDPQRVFGPPTKAFKDFVDQPALDERAEETILQFEV